MPFPGTPDPTRVCLTNGFDSTKLYEMVFTAVEPAGAGHRLRRRARRDLVLPPRAADSTGTANPVAGLTTKVVSIGSSQSASFIRGSIFYGFNQDESNRQVVDGAWGQIDGRMLFMNSRFALPDVITNLYMMGDEAPVWWADYPNLARGLPANGILHRCNETGTCPQIMETFGSLEMYAEKMSPDLVGMTGAGRHPAARERLSLLLPRHHARRRRRRLHVQRDAGAVGRLRLPGQSESGVGHRTPRCRTTSSRSS